MSIHHNSALTNNILEALDDPQILLGMFFSLK